MVEAEDIIGGRYQIVKLIGKGGFGETYLAEDQHLPDNPKCVVKKLIFRYCDKARELFEREAKVLYRLGEHPQIPFLFAYFQEKQYFYLVQEFIDGLELNKIIEEGKNFSEFQVISLLREILEILVFVHQNQIIHRDINPKNLIRRHTLDPQLLEEVGDVKGDLCLIDFGAVKEVCQVDAQGQTQLTVAVGTPGYIPDEQANGKPRLSSDIYALGIMGIQMLTGVHPINFQEDPDTRKIIWRNQVKIRPELANILDKMVHNDWRKRYPSAIQALEDLEILATSG
ncbi:protein kinase [Aerosakkonemataceae cyanobacterium BLCC-F154]|uniref:non-specific serine/threonine protein kinase n=1 Tax=Floridaenema fluviatile BLCC-F154 TaxID=3153640 RepID=A0ABV4YHJ0_9CYAN